MSPYTRPILVFVFMAMLVAQTLTRFLDGLPGGGVSNGVQGINAFLDFVLVSRIGAVPSAAMLALLTVVFTVLAYRRQHSEQELTGKPVVRQRAAKAAVPTMQAPSPERIAKAVGRPPPQAADRPLTGAEHQFLVKIREDLAGQLVHEQKLMDAQATEPVVVRLVPQIPLRDVDHPRSWLGGAPAMAEHIPWPVIDGRNANFLAQICCADLPADLWDGLGPRDGWLAFFIHPTDYAVHVLHLSEMGPWRQGPEDLSIDGWSISLPYAKLRLKPIDAWPRWPVDLIALRPGDPDPRREGHSEASHEVYKQGFDLASPEHRPFDRSTTLGMLDIAEARLVEYLAEDLITPLRQQLEQVLDWLAVAKAAPVPPRNLAELRERAATLPALIEARTKGRPMLEAALAQVRTVAERTNAASDQTQLSEDEIAAITAELGKCEIIYPRVRQLPLTAQNGEGSLWVWDFECLRLDRARHAYSRSPEALPPAMRSYFEAIWKDQAAHEMAGMGHVPFEYVHQFDLDKDVTLLELPTSNLMGWMFGDVDNLVLTIRKQDLAAGRFDAVEVQVSN
ncbi:hypothetical protein CO731_02172 [Aminobacter sp. MSH1]|uniref:DUF1963 domain-containing protein n=2 Tax=Aminobacter sp. MSH1 TaxID=374606 RepID=UPI000D379AD1|nr:DUF1963 domain-containing protein [Aminobacter sp. MSH1]AWC22706.1 hypothetical protein CO731_02172 [Aminobacter sp. MSH1]